jgi:DNA-binding MarR family transcriptional regulator
MAEFQVRRLSPEEQQIWRAYLLGSAQLSERLDAELRRFGLDLAEYEILVSLSESPDRRARMSDLAKAVHQSRSRLTHTVARLERQDLVQRSGCPTDRRGVWATLTDQGVELLRRAAPSHVEAVQRNFVQAIGENDLQALGRAFDAVLTVQSH